MRQLPIPNDLPGDVFLQCIDTFTDDDYKDRLTACHPAVVAASADFHTRAQNQTLFEIDTATHVNGNVTTKEMEKVYTQKMVPKNTPGRALYDRLKAQPRYGRCPLCCQRPVSTLDHHLNKAGYPTLVVTPVNLVPSCADCNKAKLAHQPGDAEHETLHPYYDVIEFDVWLRAVVVEVVPAAVTYDVVHPLGWDNLKFQRVRNHFSLLCLASLFASHAAEELDNIRLGLNMLHNAGGANAVQQDLTQRTLSCQDIYLNSWQSALFSALASSDWFCDGGFKI